MKTFTFKYDGRMPGLNDYIKVNRGSKGKFFGNQTKKFLTEDITNTIKSLPQVPKFSKPVHVHFDWIEINHRRDPDNFVFAKKFVLDGMVKAGVIPNDGMKDIVSLSDTWSVNPDTNGGVIVNVTEA